MQNTEDQSNYELVESPDDQNIVIIKTKREGIEFNTNMLLFDPKKVSDLYELGAQISISKKYISTELPVNKTSETINQQNRSYLVSLFVSTITFVTQIFR